MVGRRRMYVKARCKLCQSLLHYKDCLFLPNPIIHPKFSGRCAINCTRILGSRISLQQFIQYRIVNIFWNPFTGTCKEGFVRCLDGKRQQKCRFTKWYKLIRLAAFVKEKAL
jgi:hypothetical protein